MTEQLRVNGRKWLLGATGSQSEPNAVNDFTLRSHIRQNVESLLLFPSSQERGYDGIRENQLATIVHSVGLWLGTIHCVYKNVLQSERNRMENV